MQTILKRKVIQENSSGNAIDSQKMKLVLAVKAEKFEVDLVAGCLRVNGKNVKENKFVKVLKFMTPKSITIINPLLIHVYFILFSWEVITH